jgi:RNA polymerase sigma-70 factor (ECF subfamily)
MQKSFGYHDLRQERALAGPDLPQRSKVMADRLAHPSGGAGSTSLSLLDRVRSKDQAAWERLVSLYAPLVDWWCRRYRLQEADAADIQQQVFLAVAGRIEEFRRDPASGSFRGWLHTITRHKIYDHWRTEAAKAAAGGKDAYEQMLQYSPEEAVDPTAGSEAEEQGILYHRAVQLITTDFEETTRKAFWMVVVEDRLPAEVARELGISTNAVYLAKARVLSRLREEFAGLIDQ